MRHPILWAIAVLEFLFPRTFVELAEPLAFAEKGDARLRGWTVLAARVEGLIAFVVLSKPSRFRSKIGPLSGVLGAIMLLAPRRTLEVSLEISYENADAIELRSWVRPLTRVLGLGYVAFALRELKRSETDEA